MFLELESLRVADNCKLVGLEGVDGVFISEVDHVRFTQNKSNGSNDFAVDTCFWVKESADEYRCYILQQSLDAESAITALQEFISAQTAL
jgi:hypothetical protein